MSRTVWIVVACGALIMTVSMGIRQSFGLFMTPISADLAIGREAIGFALAIQQIFWGLFQPACGMIADRYGTGRVLLFGTAAYMLGLFIMAQSTSTLQLSVGGGVLIGFGLAATTFPVVLGAVGRMVSAENRSMAFGIASAGGSLGQCVMVPIGQSFIAGLGWSGALLALIAIAATMAPLAIPLKGRSHGAPGDSESQTLGEALSEASRHSGYLYLTAGFFVCGFHVSFIAFHLPAYIRDLGISAAAAASALALIGFFNVLGTYICGALGGRYSKRYLLSAVYGLRGVAIAIFLALPKSEASVLIFGAAMGLLWLGTVPLTSGLVAQMFGVRYMGTLFGIVFFSHQVGSFLGAWLGGRLFDQTGSYDLMWQISIALAFLATVIHLMIAEPQPKSAYQG